MDPNANMAGTASAHDAGTADPTPDFSDSAEVSAASPEASGDSAQPAQADESEAAPPESEEAPAVSPPTPQSSDSGDLYKTRYEELESKFHKLMDTLGAPRHGAPQAPQQQPPAAPKYHAAIKAMGLDDRTAQGLQSVLDQAIAETVAPLQQQLQTLMPHMERMVISNEEQSVQSVLRGENVSQTDLNAVRAEVETAIRSNPALVYAGFEPLYRAALQKRQAQQLKKTAAETAAARAEKVKGVPPKAPESRPVLSEKKVMPRELSYDERLRWIHDNIK
ncbi:MAG: hypothetical protein HUU03_07045 [Planctomycetaceae bacterium]|nr:hypothetical protein [Planctomycetaceae bacterium]